VCLTVFYVYFISLYNTMGMSHLKAVLDCLAYTFPFYSQFMIVCGVFYLYVFANVGGEQYSPATNAYGISS
jgi:hypothetical protein